MRVRGAARSLLRFAVCALNWCTLGFATAPPDYACVGAYVTPVQTEHLERLERFCLYAVRLGRGPGSDLGRSLEKYRSSEDKLAGLLGAATRLEQAYNSSAGVPAQFHETPLVSERTFEFSRGVALDADEPGTSPLSNPVKQVQADRIKWERGPSFDAGAFISDGHLRAVYLDPRTNATSPEEWPKLPGAVMHIDDDNLFALLRKWDAVGSLRLFAYSKADFDYRELCGMFPVYKDEQRDRLILNPTVVNSRRRGSSLYTRQLGQGFMLVRICLARDEHLEISVDDLEEFYTTIKVTPQRAKRNALRRLLAGSRFRGFNAWSPELDRVTVVAALSGLAQGDSDAVEIAQGAHLGLLRRRCGAGRTDELCAYRSPFPRGPTWEMLNIDDHSVFQAVGPDGKSRGLDRRRDVEIMKECDVAYPEVGLWQHQGKRVRTVRNHTVIGAQVGGDLAFVSGPILRMSALMRITYLQILVGDYPPPFHFHREFLDKSRVIS